MGLLSHYNNYIQLNRLHDAVMSHKNVFDSYFPVHFINSADFFLTHKVNIRAFNDKLLKEKKTYICYITINVMSSKRWYNESWYVL